MDKPEVALSVLGATTRAAWSRGLLAFLLLLLLAGCSNSSEELSLELLVDQDLAHDGQDVTTRGTVRTFEQPRHYWIEDGALNRVAVEPDARVAAYVGQDVVVSGRFTADRQQGRILLAETVTPLTPD